MVLRTKQYYTKNVVKTEDWMKKQSFLTFLTQLVSENIVEVKKSSGQDYKMQKLLLKVNMNFFAYYAMTNKLS